MEDCKPCDTPMIAGLSLTNEGEEFTNPAVHRTIIGSLQYLTYTRPDIAFAVNKLSQFSANALVSLQEIASIYKGNY